MKDIDALAIWDAKARTLIGRIDEVIGEDVEVSVIYGPIPPVRQIIGKNMGPDPDRIDHWDSYVARFDEED
jgi:hypothetical protein